MSDDIDGYTAEQAAAAANILRRACGLEPERFGAPQFVGMLSDEIRQLRDRNVGDEEIAASLASAGIDLAAADIARFYVDTSRIKRGRS